MDRREFLMKSALMGASATLPFHKLLQSGRIVPLPLFAVMWGLLSDQAVL